MERPYENPPKIKTAHTTIVTEIADRPPTTGCCFGVSLGRARDDLEVLARHEDVVAVIATPDFPAIDTMADSLNHELDFRAYRAITIAVKLTVMTGSPVYLTLMFPQKQLPVGILNGMPQSDPIVQNPEPNQDIQQSRSTSTYTLTSD